MTPRLERTITTAQTLFALAGLQPAPPPLHAAALVLIDYQNEYLEGPLALAGAEAAIENAARLLEVARSAGTLIIRVAHKGGPGGFFDRAAPRGAIVDALVPRPGETVIEKPRPNAFSETELAARLGGTEKPLLIAGFMTHMCVSSTVRAALDLGFRSSVAADACATRSLPGPSGRVPAGTLHDAALAALGDRFAGIFTTREILAVP